MKKFHMTALAICGMFLASSMAQAATLKKTDRLSDDGLETFAGAYAQVEGDSEDQPVFVSRLVIVAKNPEERIENTIKQAIYKVRGGGYSTPEDVEVSRVTKYRANLERTVRDSLVYAQHEAAEEALADLVDLLQASTTGRTKQVFKTSDGNSFGRCEGVAVVDDESQEILIAQSCYAE